MTNGAVIARLVSLPEQVFAQLAKQPATPTTARQAQRALAIALLTVAPIRLKNLVNLDRARDFQRAFSIEANRWHLRFPGRDVKNGHDLEYLLPPHVMTMVDRYMDVYQPLLARVGSTALFPGRTPGTIMSDSGWRNAVVAFVRRQCGLTVNPHLFRHLSALIFLKANPGQYESVRQLLGHKNIQTTIEYYASFDNDEAMHRYAAILDSHRGMSVGTAAA